ncbi:MAG: LamG-like jellyroll fold domain-containing protein [Gemmataceae bacterium]
MRHLFLALSLIAPSTACAGDREDDLRRAVTLYASFDKEVGADRGRGDLWFGTRFNHPAEKGKFVFEKGFDAKAFRIAKGKGVHGGALEAVDVLPNNGRIFLPGKGALAYKKDGWGGALSVWINTDPDRLLKTAFCDPIQITQKGANNGGIWFDFNNDKPRTMRMGVFPAVKDGEKGIAEDDPNAPLLPVRNPGLKAGEWRHIVLSWRNLDTGKKDAEATLYIDGKRIGAIAKRELAMRWDIDKVGIYVAVNYIGLLDELALFERALSAAEVETLHKRPGLFAGK